MTRMNLSPAEIETFLSLAETGSFSRTGAALGLSQPAVSARISHLERSVGVPLFHRTTRRVTITSAGERLRIRLEHAMAELRDLLGELRDEADLRRGRVILGASPTVAACFLADAISQFHAENPHIEIVLYDDFYGHELGRVLRGAVDLAVIPFEPDNEAFDFELLFTDRFLLAMPPGHPLASQPKLRLADLAAEPLISLGPQSAAWTAAKRAFDAAGLTFRPAIHTRSPLTSVALVRAGFGLAFVTELLAKTLPIQGVALAQIHGTELNRRIGIITAKGRAMSPAAAALCQVLRGASQHRAGRLPVKRGPRSRGG